MGDWKISVVNKTGEGGLKGKTVNFILFQTVQKLSVNSWSTAWKVSELKYPGTTCPSDLPEKTEFFILFTTHGIQETVGPFNVEFGQSVEVIQKNKDAPPTVQVTDTKASKGEIHVLNKAGNPDSLEFALYKNGKKMVSYKNVLPGKGVYLAIKPSIYIAHVEPNSRVIGYDYEAVEMSEIATEFPLDADQRDVNIGVFQKANSELYFKLV